MFFYPIEQSVSSVRPAQRFLEMFDRLGLSQLELRFVLNRYAPSNPFTLEKIETAIRQSVTARIPRDDDAFVQFQLTANDLAAIAPDSPATAAIDHLARKLCGMPSVEAPARTTLTSRLRTLFRAPVVQASAPSPSGA